MVPGSTAPLFFMPVMISAGNRCVVMMTSKWFRERYSPRISRISRFT